MFTIENARSMSEARAITMVAYDFYRNNIGTEENVKRICGKKTEDHSKIIFEARTQEEASTEAMKKWALSRHKK